jgi:hypothetical protein
VLRFDNRGKAKGEFSGVSGILDIEAGYRIGITSSSAVRKNKVKTICRSGSSIDTHKWV